MNKVDRFSSITHIRMLLFAPELDSRLSFVCDHGENCDEKDKTSPGANA